VEGAEQIKIGSDAILQPDSLTHVNDADELAKTAEQLLDSLCHEQSQKFKQSSFLALMRRIRDREVHIEGDEFREVSSLCEIVQSIRTYLCYSLLISSPDHAVTTSWWSALPRGSVKSCDRPYGCRLPLNLTSPAQIGGDLNFYNKGFYASVYDLLPWLGSVNTREGESVHEFIDPIDTPGGNHGGVGTDGENKETRKYGKQVAGLYRRPRPRATFKVS